MNFGTDKIIKFRLGKCYEHTDGKQIHICGEADTFMLGKTYICEMGDVKGGQTSEIQRYFEPLDWFDNMKGNGSWKEIPKEKFFLNNFHMKNQEEAEELQKIITTFERNSKIKEIKKNL